MILVVIDDFWMKVVSEVLGVVEDFLWGILVIMDYDMGTYNLLKQTTKFDFLNPRSKNNFAII